jgi:LiaF transmembrane domain
MKSPRRTNLLWGILVLAVAIIGLLRAFNILPAGIDDLIMRAWPVLLIIAGLSIFLRDRVRFGSVLALVVGLALVGGVTAVSFSQRATQTRSDYQETIAQPVSATVSLLRVHVEMLSTEVEIVRSLQTAAISGQFTGSSESLVTSDYAEAGDGTASLTITETHPNQFPLLDAVGRGTFRLELPAGIPLDVSFKGQEGTVSLNMSGLSLERLNMDLLKGDAVVTLPEYKPLGSPDNALLGGLVARDGSLTLIVPPTVAAHLELTGSGASPVYDATVYNLLANGVLESRNYDFSDIKVRYGVTVPRGKITVTEATP